MQSSPSARILTQTAEFSMIEKTTQHTKSALYAIWAEDWFVTSNKYREKTHAQRINEYGLVRETERLKAEKRHPVGSNQYKKKTRKPEELPDIFGDTRDIVVSLCNLDISGKTADRHLLILEEIQSLLEEW